MLSRIKRANKRVRVIILGVFLLAGGLAYSFAFGYGINNNSDGLVLDIDFSQANYNSSTRTFTDRSGNGNHAVSTNPATFVPDKDGKSGGAMNFSTTNDEVVIANNASYKTNSLTVSFWYRPQDKGGRHVIFTTWTGFTTEINSDRTFKWGLNGVTGQYFGTKKINWNEWVYITATFNNATKQQCIYFNGVKQECQTVSGNVSYGSGHLYLSGSWDWIKGDFGNVKVYNRALSDSEVKAAYGDFKPKAQFSSLEKGLIGYWPLDADNFNPSDNKVTDKSAYGNHGVALSASLSTGRNDEAGSAFDFGGINDGYSVNIPNNNFAGLSDFSMSAWIYIKGAHLHYDGTIISSGDWNNTHWSFGIAQNNNSFKTRNPHASVAYNFSQNRWYHVVYKRQGTTLSFYVDGVLVSSVNSSSNIPLTSGYTNTKIGMDTYTGNYFNFNGKISEVRIYNRALNEDEVSQLYSLTKPKIAAKSLSQGLVLDMPLTSKYTKGGGAGAEIITDTTPYSNDGENHGASIIADSSQFDGVSDYIISSKNIGSISSSSRTISVWLYPEAKRTQNLLGYGSNVTGRLFDIYLNVGGQIGGHFYNGGYDTLGIDSPAYILNQWQHFVITYDGSSAYIYFNGEYYKQKQVPLDTGSSKLFIGRGVWSSPANFQGKISNIKIYNRVLSAAEVKTLYDKGRGDAGAILSGTNN